MICTDPEYVKPLLMAIACADALGAPYEYSHERGRYEVEWTSSEKTGGGCLKPFRPVGTWTDDTALTLAEMESLAVCGGFDHGDMVYRFRAYLEDGVFSPFDHCDDIGNTCRIAIRSGFGVRTGCSHGNGSLMRIAPVALTDATDEEVGLISAVTHADDVPVCACVAFVKVLRLMMSGASVREAAEDVSMSSSGACSDAAKAMLKGVLYGPSDRNSGEVMQTLRNASWASTRVDYESSVKAAASLGGDTDTVAVVTAALSTMGSMGKPEIPEKWVNELRSKYLIRMVSEEVSRMVG